jgi:rfaE bifunctional protein kinase chain/domain
MTNKINFDELFNKFNGLKVLIVGDVMVDNYIIGKVDRVSPEAPVPVVDVTSFDSRLGGAGNVALNIKAMGGIPILCSVIGNDKEGEDLKNLLAKQGLTSRAILSSDKRKTTTKTRVLGNNHQLLRIDHEIKTEIDTLDSFLLDEHFNRELEIADVVIFEDYNKGVLHLKNIEKFINKCNSVDKPTIVDPKKSNFLTYKKTTLFKPNLKEIKEGLNIENNLDSIEEVIEAVTLLESNLGNTISMVTLSERGVLIKKGEDYKIIPAHIRNIADVSGAGDTVVSVAALCLALNTNIETLAELSNLAGGLVCEKTGVVPIEKAALLAEAKKLN